MRRIGRFALLLLVGAGAAVPALAGPASAHGEGAQEAFIKTSTVAWQDVKWSTNSVQLGDPVTVTGKLTPLVSWPGKIVRPEDTEAFLNVNAPGPVFIVTDRRVSGEFVPGRMHMVRGKTYEFSFTVKPRREGRWHLHPMIGFKTVGPIIGPGQYIKVEGGPKFVNDVELANGKSINLETYGRGNVLVWHLLALLPGAAFLVYWLIPRPLLYRAKVLNTGEDVEDELCGPRERRFGVYVAGATIGLLVIGNVYTNSKFPDTIPQQIRRHTPVPLDLPVTLKAETVDIIRYSEAENKVVWNLKVTNDGESPAAIREFTTSTITFGVPGTGQEYSMVLPDEAPINPGETRAVQLVMADPVWEHHGLLALKEVQSSLSGLLIFENAGGEREAVEIVGEMAIARG